MTSAITPHYRLIVILTTQWLYRSALYYLPKFDAGTGDLVDEETRERLRRFLSALTEWTGRFEEPLKAHRREAREGRA